MKTDGFAGGGESLSIIPSNQHGMTVNDFTRGTERLIDPIAVGKVHYYQRWLRHLPKSWQRRIVTTASSKASKMGFVVEPYALFLFYEINDLDGAKALLPEGFELTKSRVFVGDEEKYYGITSVFRLHTSVFWGARSEFYAVAKNTRTGLMSWVILDYISDTISYDTKNGLRSAEAGKAVVATTCEGRLLADIGGAGGGRAVSCVADLARPRVRDLDEKLWIEGNTSIAYGRELATNGDLFSLTFLPQEMSTAWEIPLADVEVTELSYFPEVFGGELAQVACFPFAQHMLSDSPGNSTFYGSKEALKKAAEAVDFRQIRALN